MFSETLREETLVIIPTYKASDTIMKVVEDSLEFVTHVLVVEDGCPEKSAEAVCIRFSDNPRVSVIRRGENGGVGAAMKTGFDWALGQAFDVVVKVDADGQMDVSHIPSMVGLIRKGKADVVKGNRFDSVRDLENMPLVRIVGNTALSLMAKGSTGLWSINDSTNGFFAISAPALGAIQHKKLSDRFFFESDFLFRVSLANCVVSEIPMPAIYGFEKSNLRISRVMVTFPVLHFKNFLKRLIYSYFVREWSLGTVNLIGSTIMFMIALLIGADYLRMNQLAATQITAGQAFGISLTAILGFQLLLAFLSYDVQMERKNGQRFSLSKE